MPVLLLLGCRRGMAQGLLCVDVFSHKMIDKSLKNRCAWGPSGLREWEDFLSLRPCSQESTPWQIRVFLSSSRKADFKVTSVSIHTQVWLCSFCIEMTCSPDGPSWALGTSAWTLGPDQLRITAARGTSAYVCLHLCIGWERSRILGRAVPCCSQSACWLQPAWQ